MTVSSFRVKRLRESVLSKVPGVCIERARYYTQAYQEYEPYPIYIKRARALEKTLANMSIYILDGELIVGNQASDQRTAPIFPEYAVEWIEKELNEKGNFDKRKGDIFHLPEEHVDELKDIIKWWKGKTLYDCCMAMMPDDVKKASIIKAIHGEGNMTAGDGHIVVDYEKVLKIGLKGVKEEAQEALEKLDMGETDSLRKKAFLEAVIITIDSVIHFAHRYADLARKMAEEEQSEIRARSFEKLKKYAGGCQKILLPASTKRSSPYGSCT